MAQATVNLPEGVSAEKFLEIIASYETKRVKNAASNKAKRTATQKLITAHKPEYESFLKAAMPASTPA